VSLPQRAEEMVSAFGGDDWIGRVIDGRYRVESLLGEGGMGAVFLAEHVKLAKRVALKVILPQFAGDGEVAERFAREAMASAKLDHPHVASALDYGALPEGGAYLVMAYVRGRSLRKALDSGEGGWAWACEIGAQIADALAAAHAHRIVHRDLKPENVILEPRDGGGELVKVLDFGVARVVTDEAPGAPGGKALTRVGTVIGTPGYMAPEQALGESVDVRADVYALGVLLWELVARKQLYGGGDLTAIVTSQLTAAPPPLSSVAADVPAELDDLVAKMLMQKREDRPDRTGEVRDVLKRLALGATLERKMLSGEIAVPSELSAGVRVVPTAATVHAAPAPKTGPQVVAARPSIRITPVLDTIRTQLSRKVDVGPLRSMPVGLLLAIASTVLAFGVASAMLLSSSGSDVDPNAPVVPAPPAAPASARAPEASAGEAPPPRRGGGMTPSEARATPIPSEMEADVTALLESDDRDEREEAATRIAALPDQEAVPLVVRWLVELELGDRCNDRREAVRRLGELADPRSLPALERLDQNRRGCGFLGAQDCNRCLRRDLRATLDAIRGPAAER
jgi:serine/threonine-protein kinase